MSVGSGFLIALLVITGSALIWSLMDQFRSLRKDYRDDAYSSKWNVASRIIFHFKGDKEFYEEGVKKLSKKRGSEKGTDFTIEDGAGDPD